MTKPLSEGTRMGRVRLRVGALDRLVTFYERVVGFEPVDRTADSVTLGVGNTVLLELVADPSAPERPADAAGLFHVAIRVPDQGALADTIARVREHWSLSGASDHLVSQAAYLRDPAGNGIEIYCDRPQAKWPRDEDGSVRIETLPLAWDSLPAGTPTRGLPHEADVGHVHLEVTDLERSRRFYTDRIGFEVMTTYGDTAAFLAADEYHHHLGINTWNRRREPSGDHRGMEYFEIVVPDESALDEFATRVDSTGSEWIDDALALRDPDGIGMRVRASAE